MKRHWEQCRIAGNQFQEVDWNCIENIWKDTEHRQSCTWPKRAYVFSPEYIQEETHTPSLANQASLQRKSALQWSLPAPPHPRSKGPSEKSVESRKAGQAMENWEPCYADGRDVNCQQPLGRSVWCFLKHLKNKATEPRALPLMVL